MAKGAARQVSDLLPDVLSDVLARRTGMTLDLIAGWDDIAGPEFAGCTLPEKISWPRQGDGEASVPGMLILACESHRALYVQHGLPQLIDRLNRFFGYEAIDRVRLLQKPVSRPAARKTRKPVELDPGEAARLEATLADVDDDQLRETLRRLGKGVIARRRERPA